MKLDAEDPFRGLRTGPVARMSLALFFFFAMARAPRAVGDLETWFVFF